MKNYKKTVSVLLSTLVLTFLLSTGLVNANTDTVTVSKLTTTGTVSLNSKEVKVGNLNFDEMINEISLKTGKEKKQIIRELIEIKSTENVNKSLIESKRLSDEEILKMLRAGDYIAVDVGVGKFPIFQGTYQPTGLSIYGVGYTIGQDHTVMNEILNIVFNRENLYQSTPSIKQFNGNIYVNLERNDRIYYSVDGTFYNNGTTSVGVGGPAGSDGYRVSFNVSGSSDYFDYIYHTGHWYG